jgi:hypothetical protein
MIFHMTPQRRLQPWVQRGGVPSVPPLSRGGSKRIVWWFAPFLSGSGMGMEALQLVLGLQRHTEFRGRLLTTSHGDYALPEVWSGLPPDTRSQLASMMAAAESAGARDARRAIFICHSEPGAWALPEPLYQTSMCPPVPLGQAAFVVGRAMFESE